MSLNKIRVWSDMSFISKYFHFLSFLAAWHGILLNCLILYLSLKIAHEYLVVFSWNMFKEMFSLFSYAFRYVQEYSPLYTDTLK